MSRYMIIFRIELILSYFINIFGVKTFYLPVYIWDPPYIWDVFDVLM